MAVKKHRKEALPKEPENYFIYLKNPLEYRRQLLECSRKSIYCLKNHEKIMLIRQRKTEEMHKLKQSIRELIYLNKKFNEKLPKYESKFLEGMKSEEKRVARPVTPIPVKKPAPAPRREKTELEKLEDSLANVEKKLKGLQ